MIETTSQRWKNRHRFTRPGWPLATAHPGRVILAVVSAALAAGCRTPHAIGQWVALHAAALQASLCPTAKRVPSESTVIRSLRQHMQHEQGETPLQIHLVDLNPLNPYG